MKEVTHRELDAIIAEMVELPLCEDLSDCSDTQGKRVGYHSIVCTPSKDLNQAFEALDVWQDCFWKGAGIARYGGERYFVTLHKPKNYILEASHEDLPTAICLALAEAHTGEPHMIKE